MDDAIVEHIERYVVMCLESILVDGTIPRSWASTSPHRTALYLMVLNIIHEHAVRQSHCTLRDVYYTIHPRLPEVTQTMTDKVIADIAASWNVPRLALRVHAATRGFVAGHIVLRGVDCAAAGGVLPIPGDFVPTDLLCPTAPRYVIVVEKDSIFQRLAKEEPKLWQRVPCVLVTGCGFPDHATRSLTRELVRTHNASPFGIVDYNPAGVRILTTYRGQTVAHGGGLDVYMDVRWLGLHSADAEHWIDVKDRIPLTKRDRSLLDGLQKDLKVPEGWKEELKAMRWKAELQSLYSKGLRGLVDYVERQLLQSRAL